MACGDTAETKSLTPTLSGTLMTPEQFAYWLQGFAELTPQPPTQEQWDSIKAHLQLLFKKETPPVKKFEVNPTPNMEDYFKKKDWDNTGWPFRDPYRKIEVTC
jgi:hypothetical protein